MGKKPNWSQLNGMTEAAAEKHMRGNWGMKSFPREWSDPTFRMSVLGAGGGVVETAHLSNFTQSYEPRFGEEVAEDVGFRRNIDGQGMPGTEEWIEGKQRLK